MRDESYSFLKELVEAPSPSGFEQPAAAVWRREASKYADSVSTDVLGNTIAVKNPDGAPRVMLAGHVDEIGFMVRYINDDGFIYFAGIGGHDYTVVAGQRVIIHSENGPVLGVVGRKAIHLMSEEDRKKKVEPDKLWIDIGARNKEEALARVAIGDPMSFSVGVERLSDDLVTSRSFDDKSGAFVVAETLRLLQGKSLKAAVFAVATTQEEVGLRGAKTSAFGVDAQVGVAIDVGHATDYPDSDKKKVGEFKLGGGPILHRGANINPKVEKLLFRIAKEQGIPYQVEGSPAGTGTDANSIQMTRAGVATGLLSIPLRYMHTPNEVVSLSDLENAARLLAAFIEALDPGMDWTP